MLRPVVLNYLLQLPPKIKKKVLLQKRKLPYAELSCKIAFKFRIISRFYFQISRFESQITEKWVNTNGFYKHWL